jgi:hypothetical protein
VEALRFKEDINFFNPFPNRRARQAHVSRKPLNAINAVANRELKLELSGFSRRQQTKMCKSSKVVLRRKGFTL